MTDPFFFYLVRFHNQDGAHTPVSDPDTPSTQGLSEPWSTVTPTLAAGTISLHDSSSEHASPVSSSLIQSPSIPYGPTVRPPGDHILRDRPLSSSSSRDLDRNDGLIAPSTGISLPPLYQTVSNYFPTTTFQSTASGFAAASPPTHRRQMPSIVSAQNNSHDNRLFPLSDVQEACLLRYYVEEMSHWVSLLLVIHAASSYSCLDLRLTPISLTCVMSIGIFSSSSLSKPANTPISLTQSLLSQHAILAVYPSIRHPRAFSTTDSCFQT